MLIRPFFRIFDKFDSFISYLDEASADCAVLSVKISNCFIARINQNQLEKVKKQK